MTFEELRDFLTSKMKMSHVYQPLLIRSLVEAGGTATIRQMATTFLSQDESQILYYEKRLKEMPIKVLSRHGIVTQQGDLVSLATGKLTLEQKAEIKKICEQKLQEFVASRGLAIWDYRLLDTEPIPDSLRYRVLKDAKGRCALCGATKNESVLDVDHIVPRSRGGKTVYENLQVLCSKCNRSKGNKDKTDFTAYPGDELERGCPFCEAPNHREILLENELALAFLDKYPVSQGHTLVVPKRHIADHFDMTEAERAAVNDLLTVRRKQLLEADKSIEGFNIGVNCGQVAGQSVFHCHIHLIPRRFGDTPHPKGGVRGVIPGKMSY